MAAKSPADKFASRFLNLAENLPSDPVTVDSLIWVVTNTFPGGKKNDSHDKALSLLLRDHVRNDKLGPVCYRLSFHFGKESETFLRAVLEKNPHREIQGAACLALARFLVTRLERVEMIKDQPEVKVFHENMFGMDYVSTLLRQNSADVFEETESLFQRAVDKYGDGKLESGKTVGQEAKAELFGLRHLRVGKEAQNIEGEDQDGKALKLSDHRGKVVLLNFWSEHCGGCAAFWPRERALVAKMEGKPFALIGVNINPHDPKELKAAMDKSKLSWPSFAMGQTIAQAWNVRGTPTLYLLDHKGVIRFRWMGSPAEPILHEALEKLIKEAALSGKGTDK